MPNYISKDGIFYPAKEKIGLVNHSNQVITNPSATWSNHYGEKVEPGDPYIYEGPDRAAMYELYLQGVETLGQDFHLDVELINRVRQLGYKSIDDYAEIMGWKKSKSEQQFKEKATVVTKHELPQKVKELELDSGGPIKGGFGEPPTI